jgi:hypothetical protein
MIAIAVFVVVLKLLGSISVFVLLADASFILAGPLVGRVVVVIDSSGCQWWNREVSGPFLRYFQGAEIWLLFVQFAHALV